MSENDAAMLDLADRFVNAIEKRELDSVRALFHPDAVFWTNIGLSETDLETRLAGIALEFEIFDEFAFEERRVDSFADGFVLRTVIRGSLHGGERFDLDLFLPSNSDPPHQVVVFWPGANAFGGYKARYSGWSIRLLRSELGREPGTACCCVGTTD